MVGPDIAVLQPVCFVPGIRQNAPALNGKRKIDGCGHLWPSRISFADPTANVRSCARTMLFNQVPVFAQQSQQQVLRFNDRAAQFARFIAAKENHAPRGLVIAFKHDVSLGKSSILYTSDGCRVLNHEFRGFEEPWPEFVEPNSLVRRLNHDNSSVLTRGILKDDQAVVPLRAGGTHTPVRSRTRVEFRVCTSSHPAFESQAERNREGSFRGSDVRGRRGCHAGGQSAEGRKNGRRWYLLV